MSNLQCSLYPRKLNSRDRSCSFWRGFLEGFYGGGFSGILKGAECRQVVSGHLKTYANVRLDLIDNKAT